MCAHVYECVYVKLPVTTGLYLYQNKIVADRGLTELLRALCADRPAPMAHVAEEMKVALSCRMVAHSLWTEGLSIPFPSRGHVCKEP